MSVACWMCHSSRVRQPDQRGWPPACGQAAIIADVLELQRAVLHLVPGSRKALGSFAIGRDIELRLCIAEDLLSLEQLLLGRVVERRLAGAGGLCRRLRRRSQAVDAGRRESQKNSGDQPHRYTSFPSENGEQSISQAFATRKRLLLQYCSLSGIRSALVGGLQPQRLRILRVAGCPTELADRGTHPCENRGRYEPEPQKPDLCRSYRVGRPRLPRLSASERYTNRAARNFRRWKD